MPAILTRMASAGVLLAVAAMLVPAAATDAPTLRAKVSVTDDVVTIGDFFDHAGPLAEVPLFRAPDLGEVGSVETWRVIDAARLAGLSGETAAGIGQVTVERRSLPVSGADITRLIAEEIARRMRLASAEALSLVFNNPPQRIEARHGAVEPVRLTGLKHSRRTGRFSARVVVDQGSTRQRLRFTGIARELIEVAMLSRNHARGDIVSRDDIVLRRVPRRRTTADAVRRPEEIAGKAARQPVRADEPLDPDDFEEPMLVRRGETVTIFFEIPGLTLTARGRALESGIEGDMINVVNSKSKRIVRARIIGRGKVGVVRSKPRILKLSEAGR